MRVSIEERELRRTRRADQLIIGRGREHRDGPAGRIAAIEEVAVAVLEGIGPADRDTMRSLLLIAVLFTDHVKSFATKLRFAPRAFQPDCRTTRWLALRTVVPTYSASWLSSG